MGRALVGSLPGLVISHAAKGRPLNTSLLCHITWDDDGSTVPGRGRSSRPCSE